MPSPTPSIIHTAARLQSTTRKNGLQTAISGGLATSVWSTPRATLDIDIVVIGEAKSLNAALDSLGVAHPTDWNADMVRVYLDGFATDLFLRNNPLDAAMVQRAVPLSMGAEQLYFLRPEDVIISKVIWHRPKDWADITAILMATPTDVAFVRKQLAEMRPKVWAAQRSRFERCVAQVPCPTNRVPILARASAPSMCNRQVESTGLPCRLAVGHRGRHRSR